MPVDAEIGTLSVPTHEELRLTQTSVVARAVLRLCCWVIYWHVLSLTTGGGSSGIKGILGGSDPSIRRSKNRVTREIINEGVIGAVIPLVDEIDEELDSE